MNQRQSLTVLAPLIVCSAMCLVASGEDAAALDAKTLKASGIEVDVKKQEARLDATVCLSRGILEYLVCLPGTFEHEAIFSARCKPSQLHLALLAIGLEPYPFLADEEWWAKAREEKRAQVSIEVEYEQDGKSQRRRISEFLVSREKKDSAVPDNWVFTGSAFYDDDGKNRYAADITGAMIGVIPAGAAVIQFGEKAGIPYRGDDQGLEINADKTPATGTKVKLVFAPHNIVADKQAGLANKEESTPGGNAP